MITVTSLLNWDDFLPLAEDDFEDIFAEAGQFQDKIKFNVDLDIYKTLADEGRIKIVASFREDKLIGWALFWVGPHQYHPDVIFASSDITYVLPEHRGTGVLSNMIKSADHILKDEGIDVINWQTHADRDFGEALEGMGYEKETILYAKYIGD